jgi:hypothetical protein
MKKLCWAVVPLINEEQQEEVEPEGVFIIKGENAGDFIYFINPLTNEPFNEPGIWEIEYTETANEGNYEHDIYESSYTVTKSRLIFNFNNANYKHYRKFGDMTLEGFKSALKHTIKNNYGLPGGILADLNKTKFSLEHNTVGQLDDLPSIMAALGYHYIGNFNYYGCLTGGENELPIFFIIYHDGVQFRSYIPKRGNSYNTLTKEAIGNNLEQDLAFLSFNNIKFPISPTREAIIKAAGDEIWDLELLTADIKERFNLT